VAHVSTASLAVVSVAVACPPLFHTHMHSTLPPTHPMVPSCGLPPGTLFASERHTLAYAPGDKGWIISDNDWPGQLFSFLLEADGQHWRGVKVRRLLGGGGGDAFQCMSCRALGWLQQGHPPVPRLSHPQPVRRLCACWYAAVATCGLMHTWGLLVGWCHIQYRPFAPSHTTLLYCTHMFLLIMPALNLR
jgi:hypothetical protein